jgi:hypothetical protein
MMILLLFLQKQNLVLHIAVHDDCNTLHTHNHHGTRWSVTHIRTSRSTISDTRLPLLTTHNLHHVLLLERARRSTSTPHVLVSRTTKPVPARNPVGDACTETISDFSLSTCKHLYHSCIIHTHHSCVLLDTSYHTQYAPYLTELLGEDVPS